jgi:hypothetical protein
MLMLYSISCGRSTSSQQQALLVIRDTRGHYRSLLAVTRGSSYHLSFILFSGGFSISEGHIVQSPCLVRTIGGKLGAQKGTPANSESSRG